MKKNGVLNSEINHVIASMGHFDQITVCDAGLPIPMTVKRIDLAVVENLPGFIDVVRAVAEDMEVQRIFLAEEAKQRNPEMISAMKEIFSEVDLVFIPHDTFKEQTNESRAIIRTGECSPTGP